MTINEIRAANTSGVTDGEVADLVVPFSAAQRSIWFAQQLMPQTPISIAQYVDIAGELDEDLLRTVGRQVAREFGTAMVRLLPADDRLAAAAGTSAGEPVQYFDDALRDEMLVLDFRGHPDPEAAARRWMDDEFRAPLDLFADRLIESAIVRIAEQRWFWYTRVHHILLDGYGASRFIERMVEVYNANAEGVPVPATRAGTLADLYADDLTYRSSTRFETDRRHWAERMAALPDPIRLADPTAGAGAGSRTVGGPLDADLCADVESFCAEHQVTVAAVVSAAAALYTGRAAGRDDVVLSLPVSARTNAVLRRSGGMVSNVVPIRCTLAADTTVIGLVRAVTTELSGALRHQRYRFEDMLRDGGAAPMGASRGFFGPAINVMVFRDQVRLGACTGHSYILSTGPTEDVAFTVYTGAGQLRIDLEGNAAAYPDVDLAAHRDRFLTVLANLVRAQATSAVTGLRALTDDEWSQRVPARGPQAAQAMPLPDLLYRVAARTPEVTALVADEVTLGYRELTERISRLARVLIGAGVGPGVGVATLLRRGLNSVTAELAVLAAGGSFVPIDPASPAERIDYLLTDSAVRVGITELAHLSGGHLGGTHTADIAWLAVDDDAVRAEMRHAAAEPITDAERIRPLRIDDAAYLIYTSGSTGMPKGVVISHRGLPSFALEQIRRYGVGPGARTLHFASPSFDAAVLELLLALASGATLVVVPPDIYGGAELASILRAERISHAFLTPSALASVPADDLPDLHTVIVGGEACPPELVSRWAPGRRMFNAYGPTEATVMATLAGPLRIAGEVPVGNPIAGATAVVLDRRLQPAPLGATGELYLGGVGVGLGYHRRYPLTASRFVADPYGLPGGRLYRTGDLVRWNHSGELEFRGRADRQVKIRGFRIELGEIDAVLATVAGVEFAVTELCSTAAAQRMLVGYYTGTADVGDIRDHMRAELPDHLVPGDFVRLETIPLTTSGKLDRAALPAPQVRTVGYVAPADAGETSVAHAFSICVGVPFDSVGRDDDFFALGGNSLTATRLVTLLAEETGTQMPVRWVFESPTVRELAQRLTEPAARPIPPLRRRVGDEPNDVPVSSQQARMWAVNQMDSASAIFNIPLALRLRGRLRSTALLAAITDVVERHDTLRTMYPNGPDGPVQQVRPVGDVDLSGILTPEQVTTGGLDARIAELATTAFDVATQIPLVVRLLRIADDDHILICVAHHIAADGSSTAPLAADLALAYHARIRGHAPGWEPLPVDYRDYTRWHRDLMGDGADGNSRMAAQLNYWRTQLAGLPELLTLPTDRARQARAGGRGGELRADLTPALTARVRELAATTGTTPFMVAHSALALTLARLSGSTDISVGTPVAGRGHRHLTHLVGMFVGTVVLRTRVHPDQPFTDFLAQVRDTDLAAFEHADIPFDRLVEEMAPRRSAAQHPLFQVGFSYQNLGSMGFTLDGLDVEVLEPSLGVAKSDLHLTLLEAEPTSGTMEPSIRVHWDYDRDLFDRSTIERWHTLFVELLSALPEAGPRAVGELAPSVGTGVLTGRSSGRAETTLTALLEGAFTCYADEIALTVDGGVGQRVVTYRELGDRVHALAHRLIAAGVGPEVRVAVAIRRSTPMVEAVLAVLCAGGVYIPIDPDAPLERNRMVLGSGTPSLLLVASEDDTRLAGPSLPVLDVTVATAVSADCRPVTDADRGLPLRPANAAYVIYTSGSTGTPKGVAVSHRAIADQLRWKSVAFPVGPEDTLVLKTPLTFDLSVWELFWPLINGARLVLAEPVGHRDPRYLAELMARHRVTAAHFVPSLLDAHLEACRDLDARDDLVGRGARHDLGRVLCIGETLGSATAMRATDVLGATVFNLYGPTEAAVGITAHRCETDSSTGGSVPIGRPVDDCATLILDARLHQVPRGVVGELYLRGVQLARGYAGRPDLTADRFVADPDGGGGRLYRTGDLARITGSGQLEFMGRNDFQVKIRGQRIELGEIESALGLDERVAAAVVAAHGEKLIAYLVPAEPTAAAKPAGFDPDAVLDDLRARVPAAMVPTQVVVLAELPLGIHGKVDRRALPNPPRLERAHVAPQTPTERTLVALLDELIAARGSGETDSPIGLTDDFFDLGGNSLLAARLSARIADTLGVELPVRAVFDTPTVGALADRIDATTAVGGRPQILAAARPADLPLSRPQRRMWLLEQLEPETGRYNLPLALHVDGELAADALIRALRYVLDRHEILRTTYPVIGGVPYQRIVTTDDALADADIDLTALTGPTVAPEVGIGELVTSAAAQGFSLGDRIPLRLRLFRLSSDQYVLVLVVHHIAADGWSIRLLTADLLAGYAGIMPPTSPAVQYADYALWQARMLGDTEGIDRHPSISRQMEFWRRTLADLPGPLELPADRARSAHPTHRGATVEFGFDAALVAAVEAAARAHRASVFHVVHAALAITLSRLTGRTDIVIGTPMAGRSSGALDDVVGMFVETVVLRTDVDPMRTAADFLGTVRRVDLAAQANAEIPFDEIVDEFEADRAGAHHPIFGVMLAFGDPEPGLLAAGGVRATPVSIDTGTARFDLHLTVDMPPVHEPGRMVAARWTYATDLFDHGTVAGFADMLTRVLHTIVEHPRIRVHDVDVLTVEERATLLGRWAEAVARPVDPCLRTLPDLLAAGRSRSATAVIVDADARVTVPDFDQRVARTARMLIAAGVGPERTVAVAVARSIDMLVAIHAIVVAGGAYVPLDPAQPPARLADMLAITEPVLIFGETELARVVPEVYADRLLDPAQDYPDHDDRVVSDADRSAPLLPSHPAYVLFTSGSTGVPKAVAVTHEAIVNRLGWMQDRHPIGAGDVVLQKTPVTFDVSVWELFWPLMTGARLVLAAPDAHRDPRALAQTIAEQRVSVIHFVPTMLDAFLAAPVADADVASLRLMFTSGESLGAGTAAAVAARTRATLHNLYGPTEAAVDVTAIEVGSDVVAAPPIPIGSPTAGNQVYVLDRRLRPVAPGVTGELYLGGVQLARGYLGRPDLTASRFVAAPWGGSQRLYRTGDLVRWRRPHDMRDPGLVLDYLGRSDFQVKIRGQRVELGEIEATLASHPAVSSAIVVLHDDPRSGAQLVAHVVGAGARDGGVDGAALRAFVAARLPDHMVPTHVLIAAALPVTSSGKVDRSALPAPEASAATDGRAAETETEVLVLRIIRELLGEHVGIDDDFFTVGGNSLVATRVVAAIAEQLGVWVPVRTVFDGRTPAALAAAAAVAETLDVVEVARPAQLPLGAAQTQMWLHNRMNPESSAFVIVAPVRLGARLDRPLLRIAVADVLARHEILRTVYPDSSAGPRQDILAMTDVDADALVHAPADSCVADSCVADRCAADRCAADRLDDELLRAALAARFDLTEDLPLRVFVADDDVETVVVLAVHHIAADGWSLRVLATDLHRAYTARAAGLPPDWTPLPLQYADHVLRRERRLGSPDDPQSVVAAHVEYWRTQLADAPRSSGPEPDLGIQVPAQVHHLRLPADTASALRAMAADAQATVFAVLHAALAVTLSASGAGRDVVIGTPTAGRLEAEVADLVGMFVSVLPVRSVLDPYRGFDALVRSVRDTVVAALEHGDIDVEEIIDHLGIERSGSRHPLIAVTLTLDGDDHPAGGLGAMGTAIRPDVPVARFDVEFTVVPTEDGGFDIAVVHRPEVYHGDTAAALLARFGTVLRQVVRHPEVPLRDLDLITDDERVALAALSSRRPAPAPRTLHEIFDTPGHRLVEIADDGSRRELGADEVAARSNRLARLLLRRGVGPETVVALCLRRSAAAVVAMRAVAATGAAFVPVDPDYPADRIGHMLTDSGAVIVVTDLDGDRLLTEFASSTVGLGDTLIDGSPVVIDDAAVRAELDGLSAAPIAPDELPVARHPDQLAYLIFTSGSTGRPKAVAVTHRGVAAFVAEQRRHGVVADDRVLHFASPSFDATILELVLAAAAGACTVIAPRTIYGSDELAGFLRRESVTCAFLTPAALDTIELGPGGADPLPELRMLIVGGDSCAPATARRWIALGKRFFNAYGPTEATVMATLAGPLTAVAGDTVTIGTPIIGAGLAIVDDTLRATPPGVAGELQISGAGLARGYHRRPGLTASMFVADPDGPPGSRRYRTGDRVTTVAADSCSLTHLGRTDQQLKIRGHRIEVGEVEAAIRTHPSVRAAVVTGRPGPDGTLALIAHVVIDPVVIESGVGTGSEVGADDAGLLLLRNHLRTMLPPHAVPAVIMPVEAIGLTAAGKVDHRSLPDPVFVTAGYVAPVTDTEQLVAEVFADVLGGSRIGLVDDFFEAGGNSLTAARAAARIRSASGRDVSVRDLFDAPTPAALAVRVAAASPVCGPLLGQLPRPERIPLSPAQQRMWFLNRLDPSALTENIPVVLRIRGHLDVGAFEAALAGLVDRHESLRTIYPDGADGPQQVVLPVAQAAVGLDVATVSADEVDELVRSLVRSTFDVTVAAPMRAQLMTITESGAQEHVVVLVMHHIGADGLSVRILAGELAADYGARLEGVEVNCPTPRVQYADFAIWQRAMIDDPVGDAAAQLERRRQRLDGVPPVVDLPVDRPRPARRSGRGARVDFAIDTGLRSRMDDFAFRNNATPFMVAHTALAVLLGRIGDNHDVVIGTPVAGRGEADLDTVVGMFVNMLALRTTIDAGADALDALATVRDASLDGFADALIPFDRVVEELGLPRSSAHHPVFQVAFSFQNFGPMTITLPGVEVTVDDDIELAEFDLHLTLAEDSAPGATGLVGQLVYATDLFDAETAAGLVTRYVRVLEGILATPHTAVGDLDILTVDERAQLTSSASAPVSTSAGLADGFAAQVSRTPDAQAIVCGDQILTYRQFADRVEALAGVLRRQGVGPEDRVAITAARGIVQVTAMYATAAVGAAYVPIDLTARERAAQIVATADPAIVVGAGECDRDIVEVFGTRRYLDAADPGLVALGSGICGPAGADERLRHPDHCAYVLFTSGSTGTPKGVSVSHGAVGEQLRWMQERYRIGPDDSVLVKTSPGFDLSVWEYWWPLQTGARIVLGEEGIERDGAELLRVFEDRRITVLPTVPSALSMLLDAGRLPSTLRTVLCIGEELPAELVTRLRDDAVTAPAVHNLYGPTECAVSATGFEVAGHAGTRVPIGSAQPSVTTRVLDARLHPVPPGVAGELYLGGVQLARGYHGDPARTAAAFVADPVDGSRMYRTGDLVRHNHDGDLVYLGRTDHQVQVRGFRVEPGEIEAALRCCRGVADAVVIVLADDRLVGYVTGTQTRAETVEREVATRLPGYLRPQIQVLDALPYTANGKVDRARLPAPQQTPRTFLAPETELETLTARIVAEVTGATRVGMSDSFFDLGGNSLSATRVSALMESELGHRVPVRLLFDSVDLADFVAAVDALGATGGAVEVGVPRLVRAADPIHPPRDPLTPLPLTPLPLTPLPLTPLPVIAPLAPAQRRIWEEVRAGRGQDWNVPVAVRFVGDLDTEALASAVLDVLDRHEALRTCHRDRGHGPELVVLPTSSLSPTVRAGLTPRPVDADEVGAILTDLAWRRIDVEHWAPVQLHLLRIADDVHVLLLVTHHLSVDGQSMSVLARDLLGAFAARSAGVAPQLVEPAVRFSDYARWRTAILGHESGRTDEFRRQLDYWRGLLDPAGASDDDGVGIGTYFCADRSWQAPVWDSAGDTVTFDIGESTHAAIDALAKRSGVSVFAVLQAAFAVVLADRTGDPDVRVATANANRPQAQLDGVIGNFAEDLPMRLDAADERTFAELAGQVQRQLFDGLAHPDISLPDFLAETGRTRDAAGPIGHPLFGGTLIVQEAQVGATGLDEFDLGAVRIAREPLANTVAKHELEFTMLEMRADRPDGIRAPGGIRGTLLYPTAMYERTTACEVVARLLGVLDAAVAADGTLTVSAARTAAGHAAVTGQVR
ncbi:amino acid adenylation domain-containing protein [Gordonia sp. ABSL1-1]|uniref:non-ribosomal peptide synthetase n=1 Tax=Gordonia sp. ABSL1-1 TaxID=3053923 RepID=UPI0025741EE6|nr:non-ribosomal peptide synthetase [Gordonia sp. ABSL1-1]MDL9936850.1 amino acid adenylation domain-containing protein [Gordonia sp. ABSL1-1]